MGATGFQAPQLYIDATAVAAEGQPQKLAGADGINGYTFHNMWTGTITGTLKVEASNDVILNSNDPLTAAASADWVDITADITGLTDPAGSAANEMVILSNARFGWIRLSIESVGGTGTFTSWVCSHGTG